MAKKLALRTTIVILTTYVTTAIPDIISFLDLGGAIGASVICFILPPILYTKEFGPQMTLG